MNREDREFIANRIRCQYIEEENTALDDLKRLDAVVRRSATIFGYIYGSFAAIVMGAGMSLVMTELGAEMGLRPIPSVIIGVVLGALGIAPIGLAYPVYQSLVKRGRARVAPEILRLSDELLR